jgi:hypothetical protein
MFGRYNRLPGREDPKDIVAEATPEISHAVIKALQEAISQSSGGPVLIINNLTVNVQLNAASGGGATVNINK